MVEDLHSNGLWASYILIVIHWSEVKLLSRVRLFATPWTVAYQASPTGFSRQEYWSGLPFLSPEDLPHPGIEPGSPALQADALPSEPPGKSYIQFSSVQWHTHQHHERFEADYWRSNQSIQEISPGCSLEGLMLKLKLKYFGHLMGRVDSLEETLMLGGIGGRRRRGQQRMRWLDGITNSMDMSLSNSGSWWWTGRPGMLWFMGSQRIVHDWVTELNWREPTEDQKTCSGSVPGNLCPFPQMVGVNLPFVSL